MSSHFYSCRVNVVTWYSRYVHIVFQIIAQILICMTVLLLPSRFFYKFWLIVEGSFCVPTPSVFVSTVLAFWKFFSAMFIVFINLFGIKVLKLRVKEWKQFKFKIKPTALAEPPLPFFLINQYCTRCTVSWTS